MRTAIPTLTAVAVGVTLAAAVPAQAETPAATIGLLEAQGFHVNIDRVGNAPLDQCVVTSVRNPQELTQIIRVDRDNGRDVFVPVVTRRTITVSLDCTK